MGRLQLVGGNTLDVDQPIFLSLLGGPHLRKASDEVDLVLLSSLGGPPVVTGIDKDELGIGFLQKLMVTWTVCRRITW